MRTKILNNIIWLSSDQILRLAIGFIVGAWTARYLQPEQYGLLNYLAAFVGLFSPLANLNDLNQIAVRDMAVEPALKGEVLGTTSSLKLLGSLTAFALTALLILPLKSGDPLSQIIVILLSASSGLFYTVNTIDCWFQYKVQSKYSVIARNFTFITINLIRVVFIFFRFPFVSFALLLVFEYLLNSVCLIVSYYVSGQNLNFWSINLVKAKKLIKDSWPLILSGIAISVYLRIDQTMLGQMISDREVGIYSIAVRLSDMCCFLPTAIMASMISTAAESRSRSEDEFYNILQKLFDIMVLLAFTLAVTMTLISHKLIDFVYGEGYLASADVVIVHIWSLVFVFLGIAKNVWIINENKGGYALISTLGGALINILLNLFLIPRYQSVGAAIATLISYAFADYITCFMYPKARRVGWMMTKSMTLASPISLVIASNFGVKK